MPAIVSPATPDEDVGGATAEPAQWAEDPAIENAEETLTSSVTQRADDESTRRTSVEDIDETAETAVVTHQSEENEIGMEAIVQEDVIGMEAIVRMLKILNARISTPARPILSEVNDRFAQFLSTVPQVEHPVDEADHAREAYLPTTDGATGGITRDGSGGNRNGPSAPAPPPGGNHDSTCAEEIDASEPGHVGHMTPYRPDDEKRKRSPRSVQNMRLSLLRAMSFRGRGRPKRRDGGGGRGDAERGGGKGCGCYGGSRLDSADTGSNGGNRGSLAGVGFVPDTTNPNGDGEAVYDDQKSVPDKDAEGF